jgi:sensor histidine kinase YesM
VTGESNFNNLSEVVNMLAIIAYSYFLVEAMAIFRDRHKKLFRALDIAAIITIPYLLIVLGQFISGSGFTTQANDPGFYLIRILYLIVAVWGMVVLFPAVKNDKFLFWIKWGGVSYLFFMGLVLLTQLMPGKIVFGLSAMHYAYWGTLVDIFIFSYAMSIKVKMALTEATVVESRLSKDLELQKQQEQFNRQLLKQKEEKLVAEFDKQLAEVQLTALSAQMNPHFIFNCMNSIQKYVLKNEKTRALHFLQNFSELMRLVLDNSVKTKIGLDEEIRMLEKYIQLEKQRLDDGFEYEIYVHPDLQADFFEIPGMIIQPYVENAIWHGLMNKEQKGKLQLKFQPDNSFIKCIVEDNGVGRRKAAEIEQFKSPKRKSYGMAIAQKRLELLQKENQTPPEVRIEDLLDEKMNVSGTRVTLLIHFV